MSFLSEMLGNAYKEGMTEDEISAALEELNNERKGDSKGDLDKLKQQLSKANSEASNYKKQLREKMSADEKAKAETEEMINSLTAQNKELKRTIDFTQNKSQLLGLGYDDDMATETANAMIDGDISLVFANQKKFLENQRKQIEKEIYKNQPRPEQVGNGDKPNVDYKSKIAEAKSMAEAVYYTRAEQQANK